MHWRNHKRRHVKGKPFPVTANKMQSDLQHVEPIDFQQVIQCKQMIDFQAPFISEQAVRNLSNYSEQVRLVVNKGCRGAACSPFINLQTTFALIFFSPSPLSSH